MVSLFYFTRKLCRENVIGIRADILKRGTKRTLALMKAFVMIAIFCILIYLLVPLKILIVDNQLPFLIPIDIFVVDKDTTLGYVITNLVQMIMGSFSAVCVLLYGLTFVFCIGNYKIQVHLISQDFKDLDDLWSKDSSVSLAYKRAFLRNICIKCQDMNK